MLTALFVHSRNRFKSLYAYVQQLKEVLPIFQVTGSNNLLLHVAVADVDHLRNLVLDRFAERPEVGTCETSIVFSLYSQPALPRLIPS
jgi:DNA-binding Lrp family transcriptional regulator